MSTEVQPPSPPDRSPLRLHKTKHSKFPLVKFKARSAKKGNIRSSSFGGFISRLLPSHRQEKGHTLRSEFNDGGNYDPVGLVFSLSDSKAHNSLPGSENTDGTLSKRTRSRSPRKNSGPSNDARTLGALNNDQPSGIYHQLEQTGGFADADVVGISRRIGLGGVGIQIGSSAPDMGKFNTLRRMFGTIKRSRSEVPSESKCSESSCPQPAKVLEQHETPLETSLADNKVTKTQQMFDEKRSRREQRRSLRESGDFLGVQGANPRTGYWDISDATSSSEPSQISEETRLKLDQQAKELAEQRRKYEETRDLHQRELERVQTLKDMKKKERGEQKQIALKKIQRRHGKWALSENGWSSVAEPELSPIQQSVAGTPVAGKSIAPAANLHGLPLLIELSPDDRLFPMPCAAEPTPYVNNTLIKQGDYFGQRVASSPTARQRPDRITGASTTNSRSKKIPRKPVGSPSRQCNEQSSDTIVHKNNSMSPISIQPSLPHQVQQAQISFFPDPAFAIVGRDICPDTSEQRHTFLGKEALSAETAAHYERKAIVISFRSASTRQVAIRPPLAQSLGVQQIIPLNELPLVSLKDPVAARMLSSYQTPKGPLPTWTPLTITKTELETPTSSINTSTIITIGCAPLQRHPGQVDGMSDPRNDIPSRLRYLQRKSSQIHLQTSCHQRNREREMHSALSQNHPVDTVTSSGLQIKSTKQRSIRSCLMSSPEGDSMELESTPISTFTSPPCPRKQKGTAQNAALLTYQQLRHQVAIKKTEGQIGSQLTPSKIRIWKRGDTRETRGTNAKQLHKRAPGESGGTGNLSKIKGESELEKAPNAKASQTGPGDAVRVVMSRPRVAANESDSDSDSEELAGWHLEPNAEQNAGGGAGAGAAAQKPLAPAPAPTATPAPTHHKKKETRKEKIERSFSPARGVPRSGRAPKSVRPVVVGMAQSAWLFSVVPIFDLDLGIRKRVEWQLLTWQDVGTIAATAVFAAGTFLATVVLATVVGIGLQVARAFGAVFQLLSGF